ncbi:unnamed protein product [Brassica oleracea var. botrytis]
MKLTPDLLAVSYPLSLCLASSPTQTSTTNAAPQRLQRVKLSVSQAVVPPSLTTLLVMFSSCSSYALLHSQSFSLD